MDGYKLTTNPKALCTLIDQHLEREETLRMPRWVMWRLAWHYLNGARNFQVFDPYSGQIQAHLLDEEGNMEFQSQELLSMIDRISGQISSMDVRPQVHRAGNSLGAIRERAVAQIMADGVVSRENVESANTQFAHILTALGCCGITGHLEDHPTIGLTADYEVIHPRELFPFPSLGMDYTKQRGLVRRRTVPLSWLKDKFGDRIGRNLERMYWWEAEAGVVPHHDTAYGDDHGGGTFEYVSSGRGWNAGGQKPENATVGLVRIEELWLTGHRGLCTRYVVKSGEYVLYDSKSDFEDLEVYCPIGVARFIENGSFHGCGVFDLLFSLHRQMEMLLKSLFNNIRDMDRYGVLVLPGGQMNQRSLLRDVGRGLRILDWEPDPIAEGFRPFNITPSTLGDVPGKTAAFAREMMGQISPWQNLLQEKGRVDSAAGLGFLDEKIKQLMNNSSRSVDRAWSQAHRSVLAGVAREATQTSRAIPVHHLTLDLAGAVIDPERDEVRFVENPLPRLSSLNITIKDVSPHSPVVRKQEALQLYGLEGYAGDLQRLILLSLEEGLDFAMYMEEEKSAYESIVRNILLLYGDGENPGQIVATPDTVIPEFQLRILGAFMGGPLMQVAGPEVQDEFIRYKQFLMQSMQMVLPQGVPNPDDLAALMNPEEAFGGAQGMMAQQGAQLQLAM